MAAPSWMLGWWRCPLSQQALKHPAVERRLECHCNSHGHRRVLTLSFPRCHAGWTLGVHMPHVQILVNRSCWNSSAVRKMKLRDRFVSVILLYYTLLYWNSAVNKHSPISFIGIFICNVRQNAIFKWLHLLRSKSYANLPGAVWPLTLIESSETCRFYSWSNFGQPDTPGKLHHCSCLVHWTPKVFPLFLSCFFRSWHDVLIFQIYA